MDSYQVDARVRIYFMMVVLAVLGWPLIARIVRGQILSLREQEFMVAAEATGISVSRRIFRHLVPNVIPQLIVQCTMSLGGIILTESTMSFLGIGVKFPYASLGQHHLVGFECLRHDQLLVLLDPGRFLHPDYGSRL